MNNPNIIFQARKEIIDYTTDQKKALLLVSNFLESNDNFFIIIGNAGTGKTTIAENIANYAGALLIAPTNAAVKRLREKFGYIGTSKFSTIHQILYDYPDPITGIFKAGTGLKRKQTYIVDEASMIDESVLEDLIKSALKNHAKLIFIGDDFQLEPVSNDPHIFKWEQIKPELFKDYWKIKLNEVKRNDGTILKIATHLRSCKYPEILNYNDNQFSLVPYFTKSLAKNIKYDEDYIVLVSTNKDRIKYNNLIREYRFKKSLAVIVDEDRLISVSNTALANGDIFTVEKPLIVEEFTADINVGSLKKPIIKRYEFYLIKHTEGLRTFQYTLLIPNLDLPSIHPGQLMTNSYIKYNNKLTKNIPQLKKRVWNEYVTISTYGYATSVHKSQGNEWDNVYIDCGWLSNAWNKSRWLYTAVTRAKKKIELIKSTQFKIIKHA